MKNRLNALLPVHALRESRALRVVHERMATHERAVAAEHQAVAEQARLRRDAGDTMSDLATAGAMRAGDAQWRLHVAATLGARADACDETIARRADEAQRALDAEREARISHAARVRGHHKVVEASRRVAMREGLARDGVAEQRADDDFSPRWFLSQTQTPPP